MNLNNKINRLLDEATTVNYARRYELETSPDSFCLWVLENEQIIFYVKQESYVKISYGERIQQLIDRLRSRFDALLKALNTESRVAEPKLSLQDTINKAIKQCSTIDVAKEYSKTNDKFVYALTMIEHSEAFIEGDVDFHRFNLLDTPERVERAVERLENRLDKLNEVAL